MRTMGMAEKTTTIFPPEPERIWITTHELTAAYDPKRSPGQQDLHKPRGPDWHLDRINQWADEAIKNIDKKEKPQLGDGFRRQRIINNRDDFRRLLAKVRPTQEIL